jgi:ABC-type transport system involved in multi-copper enzyme maturation permease subunit
VTLVSDVAATEMVNSRPTRARHLLRVTWLEHRGMLLGLFALLAAIAIAMVLAEMPSRAEYAQYVANNCISNPQHAPCGTFANWFAVSTDTVSALVIAVSALPVVIGVFIGAPSLSREFETGTFRFTFTQRVGRNRFVLSTLVTFAILVIIIAVCAGLLLSWLVHPFEVVGIDNQWQSGLFDATSIMLASWCVFALSLGVFLGAWLKRVVSSMAATASVVGGFLVASFMYFVKWIISVGSLTTSRLSPIGLGIGKLGLPASFAPGAPKGSWLIRAWFAGSHGQLLSAPASLKIEEQLNSVTPKSPNSSHWLSLHHVVYDVSYQPASRFLICQLGAAAVLVGLALVFAYLTLRRIRSV